MLKKKGPLELEFQAILEKAYLPRVRDMHKDFKSLVESCDFIGIPYSLDTARIQVDSTVDIYVLTEDSAYDLNHKLLLDGFDSMVFSTKPDISVITVSIEDWEETLYDEIDYYIKEKTALCLVHLDSLIEFIAFLKEALQLASLEEAEEARIREMNLASIYAQILSRVREDLRNSA